MAPPKMNLRDLPNETLIQIVRCLDRQEDISCVCRVNHRFHTLFIDYLFQFNVQFRGGRALLWATTRGNESLARKLLHFGADVNATFDPRSRDPSQLQSTDSEIEPGLTPLHKAAWEGHPHLVKLFLDLGANPEAVFDGVWTPLNVALLYGHEKIARTISRHIDNFHDCLVDTTRRVAPLHLASYLGLSASVRFFLDHGADVNQEDWEGITTLHHALLDSWQWEDSLDLHSTYSGPPPDASDHTLGTVKRTSDHILKTVNVLLDFGADVVSLEKHVLKRGAELGACYRDERLIRLFGSVEEAPPP